MTRALVNACFNQDLLRARFFSLDCTPASEPQSLGGLEVKGSPAAGVAVYWEVGEATGGVLGPRSGIGEGVSSWLPGLRGEASPGASRSALLSGTLIPSSPPTPPDTHMRRHWVSPHAIRAPCLFLESNHNPLREEKRRGRRERGNPGQTPAVPPPCQLPCGAKEDRVTSLRAPGGGAAGSEKGVCWRPRQALGASSGEGSSRSAKHCCTLLGGGQPLNLAPSCPALPAGATQTSGTQGPVGH